MIMANTIDFKIYYIIIDFKINANSNTIIDIIYNLIIYYFVIIYYTKKAPTPIIENVEIFLKKLTSYALCLCC